MMAMNPSFGGHPGMAQQHPGVHPGHPMGAPGMAHNPSQPGVQPGMPPQMAAHMAVSGPGGQMNPAAMMGGMPPNAGGPNAHALQHLNPQMFQQQQAQQFAMAQAQQNNSLIMQQQRLVQQQQQRNAMLQQAQMYGGMPGMNMPGMNAAQYQAMRQGGMQRVGMPQHLQQAHMQQGQHQNPHQAQLLAQQLAMQQQQQQQQHAQQQQVANNAMHQGSQQGHPGQMTPQQMQHLQQAQMAQAQMAQQVPQGGQNQQPQAQPQPQNQPQPQQPQQGQPQGQQPQPNAPGPQRAPTPAGAQPNQPQAPGANPPQMGQPQQSQGQGPPQNQTPSQPQQPNPALLQAAQHQQLANNLHQMQQQKHENMANIAKGNCFLKLMQFSEHLSGFSRSKQVDDLSYWQAFVSQFFSPSGVFRLSVYITDASPEGQQQGTDKQYEITQPALARYFHTHFQSGGVKQIQMTFERGTIDKPLPNGCHFIENPKASLIYWFESSHVVSTGSLRAQFDSEQKLQLLEFITTNHEEYLSRKMVMEAARPTHNWIKDWRKVNGQDGPGGSPEMSKKGKTKTMKSPQNAPPDIELPGSAVKPTLGITEAVFQFLEIVEVMGQMNPLFNFYHTHSGLSPYAALNQYVDTHITNQPQAPGMNGQPGNVPQNPRTPSFSQFPMGASPAATHLQLPNSPHMGSPAQGHMQAPGMQMQQSQQGTSSSGPSANTSPASNKRRRPSTVKAEEESGAPTPASMGGPQVNGVAMAGKKPPTPRMQKRQKGNPA